MSMIDLGFIFLLAGVVGAWLLRFLLIRLSAERWLPRVFLRPLPLTTLIVGALAAAWLMLVTRADTIENIEPGTSITLIGRITEVVHTQDLEAASVYILEDITGTVRIATTDFPPQSRSLAIIRGRVVEHAGRPLVLAESRYSTF